MSAIRRWFLGWNRSPLDAVAEWLVRERGADLSRACIALPGARAGRRLREKLARALPSAWKPPRIVTGGTLTDELLVLAGRPASRLARTLAWEHALRSLPARLLDPWLASAPAASDAAGWSRLASEVRTLFGALAAEGLDFERLAALDDLPERELGRWRALAEAQRATVAALAAHGLVDPHLARLEAIRSGRVAAERDLVLAGVVDTNALTRRTLELVEERTGARIDVLVVVPEDEADGFDALGCLLPERWTERDVPLPLDRWSVVEGPDEEARETVRILGAWSGGVALEPHVTIGVADPDVASHLARRLQETGAVAREAAGTPLARTPPARLLDALARHLVGRDYASWAALVRHPDLEAALRRSARDLEPARLADEYMVEHLPREAGERWLGRPALRARIERVQARLRELLGELASDRARPAPLWAGSVRAFLVAVYGDRALDEEREQDRVLAQSLRELGRVLDELESVPADIAPKLGPASALALVGGALAGTAIAPAPPRPDEPSIDLLGWLELVLDDAPALVVVGFQEGRVPESLHGDAWLPNSLRGRLGLEDNDRRLARDVYATTVLLRSRERVAFVSARRSRDGDPLLPSRIAFHAPEDRIAERVRHALRPLPMPREDTARSGAPRRLPRRASWPIPTRLRITAFKDYLGSPYLFYLKHVLGLETFAHDGRELDALGFGTLAHDALAVLATDSLRACADEAAIARALEDELRRIARERFGARPLPAVELQVDQLAWRLRRFARVQAERARDGWVVEHSEWKPARDATLDVDGEPIVLAGRIDRIDCHADGRWAILDYKTSDNQNPIGAAKAHRARSGEWRDLQLPLYVPLAAELGRASLPELGYALVGRDEAAIAFDLASWDRAFVDEAIARARAIVRDVREGRFFDVGRAQPPEPVLAALCGRGLLAGAGDDEESAETDAAEGRS